MEKLRIKIGKKKTVSAMVDEFMIGGTSDHNILKNRDMNNQHPINAIAGLEDALNNRVTNEKLIAEVDSALKSAKESGLFDGKDGEDGHTPQKGIDYFDGEPGNDGIGILSIEQESASSTSGGENIIKITLTDGRVQRFIIKNGSGGEVEISQMDVIDALGYTPINRDSIVDDLETRVVNLPLSAAQGAKLKDLIDDIKVPTKTSQLTNDSKFMTTDEVVAKINESISGIAGGLKFEIVDAIDTSELGDSNTIYLVPSEDTDSDNLQYYDEYMFIDGSWEKLGDTRVNLAPYYTEAEVDNLIYNVQKSIPTHISQLYNDAGYVKAEDIETGEATWDSLKGNILETIETPITWDGNTDGLETHPTYNTYYKVSDTVLTAEEAVGLRVYDSLGREYTVPPIGNGWLATMVGNGFWFTIAGVMGVFDESAGCSTGIYFNKGITDDGTNREVYTTEFILEAEKVKPELLPENIGGGSAPLEGMTVKSKTFITVTSVYEWLEENFNKVLKAIMSAQGSAYSFVNMAKNNNSEGATYCFNLTNLYNMSGNVINYATYLVVIKPQSLEFTTGQYTINTSSLSCTTNDTQIFNDEILQAVGGEFAVLYVD